VDNGLSPTRKAEWKATTTTIACVSAPLVVSVVDLLTFRQAGVGADVLGFLGAVVSLASDLPSLGSRITLRRIMVIGGAVCMFYWAILYFIGFIT
jgi:hypothetical protein